MPLGRVLAVDADPGYLIWAAQNLVSWGYQVQAAADAATAVSIAESFAPDLMLIDAFLPGPGGPPVVRTIRARQKHEVGVVYSVVNELMSAVAFETVFGIDDFVVKERDIREVADRLRRAQLRSSRLQELAVDLTRRASGFGGIDAPERKPITVMFTDVRGFTALSEAKDPETVAAVLNELFDIQSQSVRRYGGQIDKLIGDGMMALFGLARPGDQGAAGGDPRLGAMLAAQQIIDTVAEAQTVMLISNTSLALGIGIHTGGAVVGPIGPPDRRDFTAIGDTVNVASRLCSAAGPDEIVVSEAQLGEIESSVDVLDRRVVQLKGKSDPMPVYSVRLKQ